MKKVFKVLGVVVIFLILSLNLLLSFLQYSYLVGINTVKSDVHVEKPNITDSTLAVTSSTSKPIKKADDSIFISDITLSSIADTIAAIAAIVNLIIIIWFYFKSKAEKKREEIDSNRSYWFKISKCLKI
jgi:hypothetical protein